MLQSDASCPWRGEKHQCYRFLVLYRAIVTSLGICLLRPVYIFPYFQAEIVAHENENLKRAFLHISANEI